MDFTWEELARAAAQNGGKMPTPEGGMQTAIPSSGALAPMPRNPARMPEGLENFALDAAIKPMYDIGMGVGSAAGGGGASPEVGAGVMGAMALMTPMKAGALERAGIRAYHGSPHDFDRFDLSRIGTGEGAQAYGHGLYFAENPKVAQQYRDDLSAGVMRGGQRIVPGDADFAIMEAGRNAGNLPQRWLDSVSTNLTEVIRTGGDPSGIIAHYAKSPTEIAAANAMLAEAMKYSKSPMGKMYEVNINAKPEQFLDWDRPLGQQPKQIFDVPEVARARDVATQQHSNPTGGDLYKSIYNDWSRNSEVFRDAGVPGIRYLDQGSRVSGDAARMVKEHGSVEKALEFAQRQKAEPFSDTRHWDNMVRGLQKPQSSNYVLFNDKIVDILKKWGLLGPTAGGFGSLAPSNDQ